MSDSFFFALLIRASVASMLHLKCRGYIFRFLFSSILKKVIVTHRIIFFIISYFNYSDSHGRLLSYIFYKMTGIIAPRGDLLTLHIPYRDRVLRCIKGVPPIFIIYT